MRCRLGSTDGNQFPDSDPAHRFSKDRAGPLGWPPPRPCTTTVFHGSQAGCFFPIADKMRQSCLQECDSLIIAMRCAKRSWWQWPSKGPGPQAFAAQCQGSASPPDQHQVAVAFQAEHPQEGNDYRNGRQSNDCGVAVSNRPGTHEQQAAQRILHRAANGPFRITQIVADASARLLAEGMNPAGYGKDVLWTDSQNRQGSWRDLYNWPQAGQPWPKLQAVVASQRDHLTRIQVGSAVELMDILFASGRRSIESLLLALPTTDRIANPAASSLIQEGVDGSIRLLGSRKRLSSHPSSSQNSVQAM